MAKRYEVRSNRDGKVAFDADSVDYEAKAWRMTPLGAARRIARENADAEMGEEMYPAPVNG